MKSLLWYLFFAHCVLGEDADMTLDFLKWKSLNYATIFTCDTIVNLQKLIVQLSRSEKHAVFEELPTKNFNYQKMHHDYYPIGVVIDSDCDGSNDLIKELSVIGMFNYTYAWLITTKNIDVDVISIFDGVQINIDAEITFAVVQNSERSILYDVYNHGYFNKGTTNVTYLGDWLRGEGFRIRKEMTSYKYERRANMTGVILKCMIVVTRRLKNETFEHYIKTPALTHVDSMNRFNYALLLHLRDIFGFKYEMMRTTSWGYSHNGTFDGMVGYLANKQVDVGGSPIFFRLERAKVIDYTIQTWVSRPCFIFRHPKRVGSFVRIYLRPFDGYVWYCAAAVSLIGILALYRTLRTSESIEDHTDLEATWSFVILLVMGVVCQQGYTNNLYVASSRILMLSILIFTILFYQFYSASLVSSLLMEPPKNIKTLKDLLDSQLKAGCEDILYNYDYFRRTTDPVALELHSRKIVTETHSNFFNPADGLALVKKGGFAFHADIATAYKIIRDTFSEQEICELVEIQLFPPQRMMAIVQKGSPFRKLITYGLRRITEVGLAHKQKLLWHEAKPRCVRTPDTAKFKVAILEFATPLVIFLTGLTSSFILLILEILASKIRGAKQYI